MNDKAKRRNVIGLALLCLLAGAGVGMNMAVMNNYSESNIIVVRAEGEEEQPVEEQVAPEEEQTQSEEEQVVEEEQPVEEEVIVEEQKEESWLKSAWETYAVPLFAALSGVNFVSIACSIIVFLLNRKNNKQTNENVDSALVVATTAKGMMEISQEIAKGLKEQYEISNEKVVKTMEMLDATNKKLEDAKVVMDEIKTENTRIIAENAMLKDILLNIVNHSNELVASGVAEELNKKYN